MSTDLAVCAQRTRTNRPDRSILRSYFISVTADAQGRFSVYEGGEEPPPMSPPQQGSLAESSSVVAVSSRRVSEDGSKK